MDCFKVSLLRTLNLVKPQINDLRTWKQAELLLQPAFIRLLDNFRKVLESSDWESRYEEIATWPAEVSDAQKQQYEELIEKLERATPTEVPEMENLLAQIPEPAMAYELQLSRNERTVRFDMWQLCYQVCFCNYVPGVPGQTQAAEIDETLLSETEGVDWPALDQKVKTLVQRLLQNL